MPEYIFTFGCGQEQAGYCQPIFAAGYGEARVKMFELHGDKWAFQYTREEWEKIRNRPERQWPMERELKPIHAEERT